MVNPTNITNSNHQPTINSFTLVDSFHCSRLTWRHPMGNNICNVLGGMKRITSISRDLMFFVRHTKYLVKGGCPNVCWPKKYQGPTMTFHTNLTKKPFTETFPSIVQTFEYFGNFYGCCFFLFCWHCCGTNVANRNPHPCLNESRLKLKEGPQPLTQAEFVDLFDVFLSYAVETMQMFDFKITQNHMWFQVPSMIFTHFMGKHHSFTKKTNIFLQPSRNLKMNFP